MNKKLLSLALGLMTSVVFAAGSEGGGGDAVILPNGDVVLADVFLDRNQPQPTNMPKRISINPKLLLQVKIYTQFMKRQLERTGFQAKELIDLFEKLGLRDSGLVFYSVNDVQELNTFCASGGKKAYRLPDGAEVTQVACTSGDEIFLVEPIFRRMSVIQQALLLLHERMTTLKDQYGGKNYGAIAGLTSGLGELLNQSYQQQRGEYRRLTSVEQTRIRHFYEALLEITYRNSDISMNSLSWEIHPFGGGFIHHGANVEDTVFVGVTSVVGSNNKLEGNTQIIDSLIIDNVEIKNSKIFSSTVGPKLSKITDREIAIEDSVVKSSSLAGFLNLQQVEVLESTFFAALKFKDGVIHQSSLRGNIELGPDASIKKSEIIVQTLITGCNFQMTGSHINAPLYINHSLQPTLKLELADNQVLTNGNITTDSLKFEGEGEVVIPMISIPAVQTSCQKSLRHYRDRDLKTDCHSYAYKYDMREQGIDTYFQVPQAGAGVFLNLNQTIEKHKVSHGKDDDWKTEVLRSFTTSLSFQQIRADANHYTVRDGLIKKAVALATREIKFNLNHANQLILKAITSALSAQGVENSFNPKTNVLEIRLSVKK